MRKSYNTYDKNGANLSVEYTYDGNGNLTSDANKDAIRGREQMQIDKNGGAQSSGGISGNKISGISPTNKNREKYINAAKKEFEEL